MKFFKELPKSIYYSSILRIKSIKGLTKNKKQLPVIVSMTSIIQRLSTLDIVIKGLLYQDVLPEKIVLWLHKDLKSKIPKRLKNLEGKFFEIRYSSLDCPHLKLVESLKAFPTKTIITSDDDFIYIDNHLNNLYEEHLKYPNCVIANKTTQIKFDENNNYKPFVDWRSKEKHNHNNILLPLGAWGVLYPPNSMPEKVYDEDLFFKLAPKADDLWFKAMTLIKNTISIEVENKPKEPIPVIGSQKVSLKQENVKNNKNEIQWEALSNHFKLKEILLKNE
ncbi:hypothetical protein C7447_102136 [Tenacibaculum adriaticum]|uniref:Glycosyl transferase family 2 n=1 Tax=Tenacibaculum adriaticum TaxID=413713 RepID=A0A5S5DSF8_9FLAO|nr:zinc-binding alcohol dehydrogenase [Tenacibaculum adriaticum]TYP98821.1 hypothetical protein C7447_102136 [Tenacibaculum adriaticum]